VKGFVVESASPYVDRELIPNPVRSDRHEEAAAMTACTHPDDETLGRFVLGQLDRKTMARVEGHLRGCSRCGQVAMRAPDDRLVSLLRVSTPGFPAAEPADSARFQLSGPCRLSAAERSSGKLRTLVVLACLSGIMGSSVSGCSHGEGHADTSPDAQAKAKETFKKKFENYGKKGGKTSR
jgi:hypothetical protein